tara:strand:+ start:4877 stop:5146 length:270 start_codon:yes stop_codon:yes gene_type:complete
MQEVREEVPDAWHIIVADLDCHAPKQKVTLYLDAPVAKAFKAMGQGYQARINRILATYLEMKGVSAGGRSDHAEGSTNGDFSGGTGGGV